MSFFRWFLKFFFVGVILFGLLIAYGYFWGSMYGGKKYQAMAHSAPARILLRKYQNEQKEYFLKNNQFDPSLHLDKKYELDSFKLYLANENKILSKYCPDCIVSNNFYKVAAVENNGSNLIIWTINNKGEFHQLK